MGSMWDFRINQRTGMLLFKSVLHLIDLRGSAKIPLKY